jgi:hypothetical protein
VLLSTKQYATTVSFASPPNRPTFHAIASTLAP